MGKKNWGVDTKIRTTSSLMTTNILNTKITEVENKTLDNSKCITTQEFNKLTAAKNQKFKIKNFAATLKPADQWTKMILIISLQALINELLQINQNI